MRFHFMAGVSISLCAMSLALAGCGGGEAGAPTAIAAELVSEGRAQADNAPPVPASDAASAALEGAKILVFSKTAGYRHNSIGAGIAMMERLGEEHGFEIVATEDGAMFSDARIDAFDAVVFLNTTGDVLNARQQAAFERYIQSGGGYVGIHAASDTEHDGDWPWYIRLVGGTFSGHPSGATLNNVQGARITTAAAADDLAEDLPETFRFVDEWYDFDNLDPTTTPVLFIDRDSYTGAIAEGMERIAWYHDYDGGRVFYTNLGHRKGTFSDDLFLTHFVNGLVYAVGDKDRKPLLAGRPDADRFAQDALTGPLNEPVSLDVLDDGSVLIVERGGKIKRWKDGEVETVADYEDTYVSREEFGMIAVAGVMGDDEHLAGGYVMYDRRDGEAIMQRVAYVPFTDGAFDFDDQRLLLEWQMEDNCCHTGGALRFGPDGHLFIAVGDNSNPFMSEGLAPLSDETPAVDARRTAGNTNDLRGSIMRILPSADGTYEIPEDNLFADGGDGRPEIYVMGTRNPYTIGFDNDGTLYFGDIGPDARETTEEGPRGYDEINRVTEAGYFGWPLFIGDNEPYRQNAPGEPGQDRYYDPLNPVNDSPHNTGAETLPPAQPAFIYYPYAASERFPELGAGGRNALVAGVYHRPENAGEGAWPEFFEGKLIISDFMRRYVQAVAIGEGGSPERLTPVAQDAKLASPIDLEFGPDGALYVLEYGSQWFEGNDDARLSRIRYTGDGNRAPLLTVSVDKADGRVPLSIDAGTNGTFDPDGNEFTVEWSVVAVEDDADFGNLEAMFGEVVAEGMSADFTVEKPGRHLAIARATDAEGAATYAASVIEAGNERPEVAIRIDGNRTFFWPGREDVSYQVSVTDGEDGSIDDGAIDPGAVTVTAYVEQTKAAFLFRAAAFAARPVQAKRSNGLAK